MANLVITFTRANDEVTVEDGSHARTEEVAIGAGAATGTLAANSSDNVVALLALADCWIAIDTSPGQYVSVASAGTKRRPMKSGQFAYYRVSQGEKVAVITRT